MITIEEAKRLVKRALLSNIVSEKQDLAITPLISGKHGIGKSAMIKSIAVELGGVCITVEGGTLKEGEITGLPYQYKDETGNIKFRFLPYYAVERIQNEEKRIFEAAGGTADASSALAGGENRWARNFLTPQERLGALKSGAVCPVIIFIDEINRTENTVYKELMNILLTRSVNGYQFPWWVLFAGAMNPSTQNSIYATNEMDPAQLDRFLKIKVGENASQWLKYGQKAGISPEILSFIKENPKCLSSSSKDLEDEEKPTPSPRGWDMAEERTDAAGLLHRKGKYAKGCGEGHESACFRQAGRFCGDDVFCQPGFPVQGVDAGGALRRRRGAHQKHAAAGEDVRSQKGADLRPFTGVSEGKSGIYDAQPETVRRREGPAGPFGPHAGLLHPPPVRPEHRCGQHRRREQHDGSAVRRVRERFDWDA